MSPWRGPATLEVVPPFVNVTAVTRPARFVTVATSGGDYTSVASAIAAVTDATSTAPVQIRVYPGRYVESPLTMKPYVNVVGAGGYLFDTILAPSDLTQHFIRHAAGSVLRGLSIEGPTTTDTAAIDYQGTGFTPAMVYECVIRSGNRGIWCHPATYGTLHVHTTVNQYSGSAIQKFLGVSGAGNVTALQTSAMSGPSGAVVQGFVADGASCTMTLDLCAWSIAGGTGLYADNGAQVRVTGGSYHKGTRAIHVGANGANTFVDASGGITIASENFSEDVRIDSSSGVVWAFGRLQQDHCVVTPGGILTAAVIDPVSNTFSIAGGLEVTGAGALDAAGIFAGTTAPSDAETYAQWLSDKAGHWCWIDIS